MSKYHRDEFDRVPESSSRQGVHRARLEPPKGGGLALIVTTGIIALLIGAAAYFILPNLGLFDGAEPATDAETAQITAAASEAPTDPATAEATDETSAPVEPSAETTASSSPSASETQEPAASVDKTVPVVVLNSTGMAGMAGTAGDRLNGEGWTVSFIGNWGGAPQATSSILYNGEDQLANAQAIGEVLNITEFIPTAQIQDPLTVVIGPGFQ